MNSGNKNSRAKLLCLVALLTSAGFLFVTAFLPVFVTQAQTVSAQAEPTGIRIGERLTYNISVGRFPNTAYAELYAVSRGRITDKDAIEIRSKFKTLDLASATVYLVDETRTTFASPATGLPLHISITQNTFGLPKETITSFLASPTTHFDIATMIYRIRQAGGNGSLTLLENERVYPVTFQAAGTEKLRADTGDFETTIVAVQSEFFSELGFSDVRINLSNDEARLPVLIRCGTPKGQFRAALSSVQMIEPEVVAQPTPIPSRTPQPERTPKPTVTPTPYIDNQPLPNELAFEIGESLEYKVVAGSQQVATMRLAAKERTLVNRQDSLLLEAAFSDVRPGSPVTNGDFIRAYVEPETLAPRRIEMKFAGALRAFSGTAVFDRQGSLITHGGATKVEAPVGTHSILSLLYAARSFNLKPSRDLNNPINDTRVAVFWETRPYVFTLRPSAPDIITIDGKAVAAQLVSVSTKNPTLDQQNIKVWLSTDGARVPLRFSIGPFQMDLVSANKIQPK